MANLTLSEKPPLDCFECSFDITVTLEPKVGQSHSNTVGFFPRLERKMLWIRWDFLPIACRLAPYSSRNYQVEQSSVFLPTRCVVPTLAIGFCPSMKTDVSIIPYWLVIPQLFQVQWLPSHVLLRIAAELEVHRDGSNPGAFQRHGRRLLRSWIANVPHSKGNRIFLKVGFHSNVKLPPPFQDGSGGSIV